MNEIKKYNVIKAVYHGKKTKQRACVELHLSLRQINQLLKNYAQFGKQAFSHKNQKPSTYSKSKANQEISSSFFPVFLNLTQYFSH